MSSSITPVPYAGRVQYDADRRSAKRYASDMRAILRFQDRLQVIQGNVCDISIGGAGFICQQAAAANSKCTLQFDLPQLKQGVVQSVSAPVIVASSMQMVGQAYQFRINLRFAGLAPAVRGHIEAFIRQSLSRG